MRKIGILLLSILLVIENLIPFSASVFAEEEVVKIDKLSVSYRDGGKLVGDKYTWVTDGKEDSKDHRFTFRINYAISGTYDYAPEKVQIKIPKRILRDRDGNFADYYDVSVPEYNDPDIDDTVDFVFKEISEPLDPEDSNSEEVEYILIYNRIPVPGGTNGFIEVSYLTSERTWEYKDMGKSDDFFATMHIEQGHHADPEDETSTDTYIEANKESNKLPVYIDTTAKITNIDKQVPKKLYRTWQDSWGNTVKPQNPDNYFYLVWPIRSWITANQPYNFSIQDIFTAKNGFVVGYSLSNGNFKETYPVQRLKENYSSYSRYDYVLTAHPKADYTQDEWQVKNSVKGIVDPYDQVDADTEANDNAIFKYKAPKWQEPTGHFMLYKKGYKYSGEVNYWGGANSEEIRNYKLDQFKEGEINELTDLRYRVLQVGYAYPWTRNSALQDPSAFGHNPVKYVVTDNELFIGKLQNNDNDAKLDYQDANIYRLDFNLELWDANFDEEELKFSTGPRVSNFKDSEWVDFFVEVKNSGEYVKIARWNPQDGTYTSVNSSYIQEATGKSIKFNRNDITGFKAEHSNARYYTELNLYPYVTLHNTDKVMNFIGEDMKIYVKDYADSKVYDYQNNEIVQFNNKFGYDYSMGIVTDGHITKKVKDTRNNKVKKNYVITWESSAYESFHDEEAVFRATEQSSGTFYDLLPLGGEYLNESVKIYGYKDGTLSEYNNAYQGGSKFEIEDFDISIKENYKKSGRDLLTIKINEPAEYYTIVYDSVHTWNNIKDYGKDVVNDVAYETGNEKIGDGQVDGSNTTFGSLNPDSGNAKKFLYEDAQHHISLITNALLNLKKQVRAAEDEHYSYKTRTYPDSDYYYNIRFATDDETTATDLMIMDSLENYTTASGETSAWRGSLKGINVKEIELLGADPKIYYSSVPNLDLEKYKNRDNYPDTSSVLSDKIDGENAWVSEETFGDPSNATAFLVDIRTKQGGGKFVLDYDTGVSMTVAMHSPKEVGALDHYNSYNNIYLWDTVHSKDGDVLEDSLVHQDFTQITYVVTADIPIHKVSAKDNSAAIKGTKWELKGDSVYGNTMDQEGTTDANGNYTFKKIEAGTYTLRETYVNNDYFINPTTYTVIIGGDGSVQIGDGTEEDNSAVVTNPLDTDNNRFVLTNEVRVHGDLEFTKVGLDTEEVASEAYAVFDSADGSLTFFRDEAGKYNNNQVEGAKIYYTNIETLQLDKYQIPWHDKRADVQRVVFQDVIKPVSTAYWFDEMYYMSSITSLEKLDTSKVTDMRVMFYSCSRLTSIDLSNFDTSNVTNMEAMFYNCQSLTSLDVSHFDTSNVINMRSMFEYCYALTTLDVSHFDTSKVMYMRDMFKGCFSLESLDVSNFNTSNVENMYDMFYQCNNLTTTLNIMKMPIFYESMFYNAAIGSGSQITLKYIDPVTSANIDTLVATKSSRSNVVNGGEGTFIPPDISNVYNSSNRSPSHVPDSQLTVTAVKPRPIGNTTFKLTGTSDYGTEYNEYITSTSRGKVSFKDIEKGTYELIETKPNDDYINPNIKYTVIVDENGNISIDGKDFIEKKNGETYLQNEAWHNFSLRKTDAVNGGYLEGAEFKLVGTDEYGKEVDMHETSNSNGRVTFDPLASGTYILQETKAPKNYEANPKKYVVEIDRLGKVKIDGLSQDEQGFFVFPNQRGQDGKIKIIKKWNDGKTGEDAENRELPEITISTKEPKAKKGISVTKRWEGDIPEDRPDNIVVRLVKKIKTTVDPLWGEAYAVFDSADGSLTFFRDEVGKYSNEQFEETKTYYTGIETREISEIDNVPWRSNRTSIQSVTFEDVIKPKSTAYWFDGINNVNFTSINGLEKLDTSNTMYMNCMFQSCYSLTSLNVSHFDTSNVTRMQCMFYNCKKLTSLDVNRFDTRNVTNMRYMFSNCQSLTSLDVSHFDTSTVTDMQGMFDNCQSLISLDVSHFDTRNVMYMNGMFYNCKRLTSLDLSHFDTRNITYMYSMFEDCENLTTTLNIMKIPSDYSGMCEGSATESEAQITLKYIDPVISADIDALVSTKSSGSNVVNGGQGTFVSPTLPNILDVYNENNPSPSKVESYETTENKIVETSKNWLDNRDGTWTYDFNHTQEDGDEYYVYEEEIAGYISDAVESSMKEVKNSVAEIVNKKTTEAYAVYDSSDDSLIFFRDRVGKYTSRQWVEGKQYYTGIETNQFNLSGDVPWNTYRINIKNVEFQDPIKPVSTKYWFNEMKNITGITNIEYLDTSSVTDMCFMFYYCKNLRDLNLSHFDTRNVIDMQQMFYHCDNLTTTLNVMNMPTHYSFMCLYAATGSEARITLKYIDPVTSSNIDTLVATKSSNSNVVNGGQGILSQSNNSINVSNTNSNSSQPKLLNNTRGGDENYTPKTPEDGSEAYAVFDRADGSLTFFRDNPGKYTNNQTDGTKTYYTGMETTDYTHYQTPWYDNRTSVKSVTFQDLIKPVSTESWFNGMSNSNFTSITGLDKLDTSNVTDMRWMFDNCKNLTSLDVSHFDTSNVTDMEAMFNNCQNLTSLDVSRFDTSKVTDMSGMFYYCSNLTSLDVSHFDTSNVTDMGGMFWCCYNLTSLDVTHFNTSKVTNMSCMFDACSSLTSLDLRQFDTSNVTDMSYMFAYCLNITELDLSNFDTSNVTNMISMFDAAGIKTLNISSFDTSNLGTTNRYGAELKADLDMFSFYDEPILTAIALGENSIFSYESSFPCRVGRIGTWEKYATLSMRPVFESTELNYITDYDGSNPGWYKLKGKTVSNENDVEDKHCTADDPSKWVKVDDETWEYTFDVFDDEAQYYAWESEIPNEYTTDTSRNNYQIINDGKGNYKQATIWNHSYEKSEEFGNLKIEKEIKDFTEADSDVKFVFDIELKPADKSNQSEFKYSHTPNISDDGTQNGDYSNGANQNEVITIPGAKKLNVKVIYGGESAAYDWACVWQGSQPNYTASSDYSSSLSGKLGGGSNQVWEQEISGDTVTIGFCSDEGGVGNGYGYYAVITPAGMSGDPKAIEGTKTFGDTLFKDGKATIHLKHGESITIPNLPIPYEYIVTERPNGDYPLDSKKGDVGELNGGETSTAKFINKKVEEETISNSNGFKLTKKLEGGLASRLDEFEFAVSFSELVPNKTYTYGENEFTSNSDGEAEVSLTLRHNDIVEFTNLPIGSKYQITELSNDYTPRYKITEANDKWNLIEKGQNTGNIRENLGTSVETVDEDEDITVTFINTMESSVPTNVTRVLSMIALLIVAICLLAYKYLVYKRNHI